MLQLVLPALCLCFSLAACAAPQAVDGDDEPALTRAPPSALRASNRMVSHGPIMVGATHQLELTRRVHSHHFDLRLSTRGELELRTFAVPDGLEVDTVLTLLARDGAGVLRVIASSDDAQGSTFASLRLSLDPGDYQVRVRGFSARTRGAFALSLSCVGAQCAGSGDTCLFGEQFVDLRSGEHLAVASESWIRAESELRSEIERAQLVLAVQQSSHTDVRTAGEALERVDQQEVRRISLVEQAGSRVFVVFEYGAGDNSYGAIFPADSTRVVASIHDGDLLACTEFAQRAESE